MSNDRYGTVPDIIAAWQRTERERDEAQLMVQHNLEAAQRAEAQLEQAVALLREAPDKACDCEEGRTCGSCEYNTRKDAFLTGQPAPAPVVDDAMVERARKVV